MKEIDEKLQKKIDEKTNYFTNALRTSRKERHLTQEQFAAKASINEKHFGKIERGESSPSYATIIKICEGNNIEISKLLN